MSDPTKPESKPEQWHYYQVEWDPAQRVGTTHVDGKLREQAFVSEMGTTLILQRRLTRTERDDLLSGRVSPEEFARLHPGCKVVESIASIGDSSTPDDRARGITSRHSADPYPRAISYKRPTETEAPDALPSGSE